MTYVGHIGFAYRTAGEFTVGLERACVAKAATTFPVFSAIDWEKQATSLFLSPSRRKGMDNAYLLRRTTHPSPRQAELANGTKAESQCLLP